MACTQIPEPASTLPATADWQKELAKVTYIGGEARKFILTNWLTSAEPQVASGSRFEVNGAFYVCSSDESITGWAGISDGLCYVYATASAGTVTFSYSATEPIYSASLGGYYNGTARALFRILKVGATGWTEKIYQDDTKLKVYDSYNADVATLAYGCNSSYGISMNGPEVSTGTEILFELYKPITVYIYAVPRTPYNAATISLKQVASGFVDFTVYTHDLPALSTTIYYDRITLNPGVYKLNRSNTGPLLDLKIVGVYGQSTNEPSTIWGEV